MSKNVSIAEKRNIVLGQIAEAAKAAGRTADQVTLVAVSKVQPDRRIAAMLATGQRVFGENRVQEAQTRWGHTFSDDRKNIELRLIGPLQTNKVADACALFDVIETLDREKLAKALVKVREKGVTLPRFLVQVNTGEEPQKAGIAPRDVGAFLKTLRQVYDLHPEGLMCIPPLMGDAAKSTDGEAPAPHFWLLNKLAADNGLSILSMGMSADFETAIRLGATHVRVGSALFGARDYG